jgi:hypothetical protein
LDKAKRRVIADELSFLNVQLVHVRTQISMFNRIYGEGLTDKEKNYLSYRYDELGELVEKNHKLWERLHFTAGHR